MRSIVHVVPDVVIGLKAVYSEVGYGLVGLVNRRIDPDPYHEVAPLFCTIRPRRPGYLPYEQLDVDGVALFGILIFNSFNSRRNVATGQPWTVFGSTLSF